MTSIINNNLWNKASWSRATYASAGASTVPVLGLIFQDAESGKAIFQNWRRRFGKIDEAEVIRLSFIMGIDKNQPLHFLIHITQSQDSLRTEFGSRRFTLAPRIKQLEASSLDNLNLFITAYQESGEYYLAPIGITENGLQPHLDLTLLKRKLYVMDAWKVDSKHEDAIAITNCGKTKCCNLACDDVRGNDKVNSLAIMIGKT